MSELAVTLTVDELRTLIRDAIRAEVKAPDGDVMTAADVAKMLKVSERTVANYVDKESLPGKKLPNGWRFFRSDVVAWVKGRK